MNLYTATQIVIEAIFYTAIGFIAAVSVFWPWWRSQIGWTITAKTAALALAVLPAMIVYWFGKAAYDHVRWLGWVAFAALAAIPPILIWRLAILWHVQRHQRDIR